MVGRTFLPEDRQTRIAHLIHHFSPHNRVTAHRTQQLLGLMAFMTTTVQHARLKMRPLQMWFLQNFDPLRPPAETTDSATKADCSAILVDKSCHPKSWATIQSAATVPTGDYGCKSQQDGEHTATTCMCTARGHREKCQHINQLELLAVIKAFRSFKSLITGQDILLVMDNTTVMHYVNKQGGTHSLPGSHNALMEVVLPQTSLPIRSSCCHTRQCHCRFAKREEIPHP